MSSIIILICIVCTAGRLPSLIIVVFVPDPEHIIFVIYLLLSKSVFVRMFAYTLVDCLCALGATPFFYCGTVGFLTQMVVLLGGTFCYIFNACFAKDMLLSLGLYIGTFSIAVCQ